MTSKRKARIEELTNRQIKWGAIVAVLVMMVGFTVWHLPPTQVLTKFDAEGNVVSVVNEEIDATTPFVVLMVGGIALLAFIVNGLRFFRITAGGVSVETPSAGEAAVEYYERAAGERDEQEAPLTTKSHRSQLKHL